MARKNWSKEELVVAFNLYLKLSFGQMHRSNPDIINLARLIGRTPSSVAMRLSNFASIDPYHQSRGVVGLPGGKKQCKPIWDEFSENREDLMFESERILAAFENQSLENKYESNLRDISHLEGEMKVRVVKTRVNQQVFREVVMATYDKKCVISGIDIPELLVASHIIPWSDNDKERLNPANGICLSALYDKAFDGGLIGISTNHKIMLSSALTANADKEYYTPYFSHLDGLHITFPDRFRPKKEFLEYHLDVVYRA